MKNRTPTALAALLSIALLSPATGFSQEEYGSTYKASVDVGYVVVPFVARDQQGRAVDDLRERDVRLYVGGKRVRPDMFTNAADAPVSFTILLDASGSMGLAGKFQTARLAIRALLKSARPDDDFALHVFSRGEVREVVPFTRDRERILAAMQEIEPWGKTAFYDALARMPDESILGENGSRAIVILTDALDNASTMTRSELTTLLEGVGVPVYPLGIRMSDDPRREKDAAKREHLTDLDTLQQIADISGGQLAVASGAGELIHAIHRMDRDLRSQYLLGFSPTGRGPVRFRPIEVRLARGLHEVRVRAGYRGTEPPLWTSGRARAGSK